MTDSFKKREKSFEDKFAHDEQLRFMIESRCCKKMGLWAAQEIGLDEDEAESFARSLIDYNLKPSGLEDVHRALREAFDKNNCDISDHMIELKRREFCAKAEQEIMYEQA